MRDLKYLAAYLVPTLGIVGLLLGGHYSYLLPLVVYIFVPILEAALPVSTANFSDEVKKERLNIKIFDWLLYFNVVLVYGILLLFIYKLNTANLSAYELIGSIVTVGVVFVTNGINVAHELGHRKSKIENRMSQALLLPSLYIHFFIEHNLGHHKNVATDLDPASARYNELVYTFWFRSVIGSYKSAWNIEKTRLKRKNIPFWSTKNQLLMFHFVQFAYIAFIFAVTSFTGFIAIMLAGIFSFLMLETINYVEHYGLRRKKLPSGRYEKVQPIHSWNSEYEMGKILLYELTRHSDHHYQANKKYQILDHYEEAPELPLGYPGSIILSLIPPAWFMVMNKRVKAHQSNLVVTV